MDGRYGFQWCIWRSLGILSLFLDAWARLHMLPNRDMLSTSEAGIMSCVICLSRVAFLLLALQYRYLIYLTECMLVVLNVPRYAARNG